MSRWRVYNVTGLSPANIAVTDPDNNPDLDHPSVAKISVRWRLYGKSRGRRFPATRQGRADASRLHRLLQAAQLADLPPGPDGTPDANGHQAGEIAGGRPRSTDGDDDPWTVEQMVAYADSTVVSGMRTASTRRHYRTNLNLLVRLSVYPAGDPADLRGRP